MREIELLSQETIDKIAAGEVVERPASVVKELVENAVDAGANAVTVEIRDGGISLIRITDNGSGIPKEQVRTAFLRHATSKIRTVDDLLTAGTLGFRGEALSSIAAVCQVELITKTAGSLTGVRYVIEGGEEKLFEEIGAPEGTTFLVRNIFYHTPVRKKFLKTAATEAGYVSDLMERLALSHPEISFKLISNRDTKLHTSGNGNRRDVIYGIYGREITSNIVAVDLKKEHMQISGFIGKPVISRGNRNYENYFVNGRYVRSAIVARAIEDAYKPFMMNHRYPFTVLMLDIDTEQVDVNVHPTKLEVRFAEQAEIYDNVSEAVKEGLLARELIPEFTIDGPQAKGGRAAGMTREGARQESSGAGGKAAAAGMRREPAGKTAAQESTATMMPQGRVPQESSEEKRENGSVPAENPAASMPQGRPQRVSYPEPFEKVRAQLLAESKSPYEPKYPHMERRTGVMRPVTGNISREAAATNGASELPSNAGERDTQGAAVQMELFENRLLSKENQKKHRIIGQVFETYWIVEFEDKMYIIDQHAAHEKVMYERFMKELAQKKQTSQMITPPVIVSLSMQEEEMLRRHMEHFTAVGFEIEHFGGREYSVRAVPGNLYGIADRTLFIEMLDGLTDVSERASAQGICEKIASMSCKAAVKGNQKLSATEADALIGELLELENPYNCPHGRPTIISMTKYELEKKFKRIV